MCCGGPTGRYFALTKILSIFPARGCVVLREIVEKVVVELGGEWFVVASDVKDFYNEYYVYAQLGDDKEKRLSFTQDGGKLTISGDLPRYNSYTHPDKWECERAGLTSPGSIGVSITKSPNKIAKDIERRLLPVWLPAYQKGKELIAGQRAKDNAQAALTHALRRDYYGIAHGENEFAIGGKVNVKVDSNLFVDIKLNDIGQEAARKILDIVTKMIKIDFCKQCGEPLRTNDYCSNDQCDYHDVGQDRYKTQKRVKDLHYGDLIKVADEWWFVGKAEGGNIQVLRRGRSQDLTLDPTGFIDVMVDDKFEDEQ